MARHYMGQKKADPRKKEENASYPLFATGEARGSTTFQINRSIQLFIPTMVGVTSHFVTLLHFCDDSSCRQGDEGAFWGT
jgi:hypothetical protein